MRFDDVGIYVVQKILPKISGSSNEVLDMLFDIFELFNDYRFSNREYLEEKELKELKEKVTDLNEGSDKINYKYKLTNKIAHIILFQTLKPI